MLGFRRAPSREHAALMREARDLIRAQSALIDGLQAQLTAYELMHVRAVRDLVEQFLYAQEAGIDVRDELLDGWRDLADHVARLEEHV